MLACISLIASLLRCMHPQVCANALSNQVFQHSKVQIWVSTIIENVLKELASENSEAAKKGVQKFKYVGAHRRLPLRLQLRRLLRVPPSRLSGCMAVTSHNDLHLRSCGRSQLSDAAENGRSYDHRERLLLG